MPFKKPQYATRSLLLLKLLLCSLLLSSCSLIVEEGTNQSGNNNYVDAEEVSRIQIPADFEYEKLIDLYPIPVLSETADEGFIDNDELPLPTPITNDVKELVQLQALSESYWVLVKETPSQIWAKLKQFTELNNLKLLSENPTLGFMDVRDNTARVYRFRVMQGLQPKSSEISLRTLQNLVSGSGNFPVKSDFGQLELDTLEDLTVFLTNNQSQAAYSYAALGISNQQRIVVKSIPDKGIKYLLINEKTERTQASLKQALLAANFEILMQSENNLHAKFLPQLPENEQPGFFLRLFGVSPKLYDDDIEFAGESYIFNIDGSGQVQQLSVSKAADYEWASASAKKRELNAILLMIKRSLY